MFVLTQTQMGQPCTHTPPQPPLLPLALPRTHNVRCSSHQAQCTERCRRRCHFPSLISVRLGSSVVAASCCSCCCFRPAGCWRGGTSHSGPEQFERGSLVLRAQGPKGTGRGGGPRRRGVQWRRHKCRRRRRISQPPPHPAPPVPALVSHIHARLAP